jgi:hypothetical protein
MSPSRAKLSVAPPHPEGRRKEHSSRDTVARAPDWRRCGDDPGAVSDPRAGPSRMIGRTDMKTSPNQTVEPTGAPRWDFDAPGNSKVPGFGGRQARAPVAHFSRWAHFNL